MQTFLPYADFQKSAQVLDYKRLGKQRVEVLQILKALHGETKGWINHPAVKMWRGFEDCLIDYGCAVCDEWLARGYKDTCKDKILAYRIPGASKEKPAWLGNTQLHTSHQSNLLRKDIKTYQPKFEKGLTPDMPYCWPV